MVNIRISKAIGHAAGGEGRARAPRRVALHVDRHRVHRDVRRGEFNVHRERSRVTAQPLRPDAKLIDRSRELRFELGAFRVGAMAA